jgi:hypothetical protein
MQENRSRPSPFLSLCIHHLYTHHRIKRYLNISHRAGWSWGTCRLVFGKRSVRYRSGHLLSQQDCHDFPQTLQDGIGFWSGHASFLPNPFKFFFPLLSSMLETSLNNTRKRTIWLNWVHYIGKKSLCEEWTFGRGQMVEASRSQLVILWRNLRVYVTLFTSL